MCFQMVEGIVGPSTECNVRKTEDSSVGVRTWLQLMCCALTEEQGCPQFWRRQAGETQGDCIVRGRLVGWNGGLG